MHSRNYKTILIDKTDWIYIEFLSFSENSPTMSKDADLLHLRAFHLLKQFTIQNFNIFTEIFHIKSNSNSTNAKTILYLQTDLSNCSIISNDQFVIQVQSSRELYDEAKFSLYKTSELIKCFDRNRIINNIINESIDDPANFENPNKIDLNHLGDQNIYLFKVLNIGCINSLANTQFKSKLRADIHIEITKIDSSYKYDTLFLVIALISKSLFYYNFFYRNFFYLLKTKIELNFNFKKFEKNNLKKKSPIGIIFLDEEMSIVDNFLLDSKFLDIFSSGKEHEDDLYCFKDEDFISNLTGTLIEKKLKSNSNRIDLNFSFTLMDHFDLLIPNQQFKLVIKLPKSDNGSNFEESVITVYYDTRFSIFPLCILPGIDINVTNLVKKSEKVYKSNSNVSPSFYQNFNFLNFSPNRDKNMVQTSTTKKKDFFHTIESFDHLYNNVYSSSFKNDASFKIDLLFKNSNIDHICGSSILVLAQIQKIFNLQLRLKCKSCNSLANSCKCEHLKSNGFKKFEDTKYKVEFSVIFLIDDHSSTLKITYNHSDYDLKRSDLFDKISDQINLILFNYLNEIQLPNVPIQFNNMNESCNENDYDIANVINKKTYESIKEKLSRNEKLEYPNGSCLNDDVDGFFENNVKQDIYKTIYDFLFFSVLDKYFVFNIDINQNEFLKNSSKSKLEASLFKLSEINSNEQFKSVFYFKCNNFFKAEKFLPK